MKPGRKLDAEFELFQKPEDSDYRFVVMFKDMHILKQWDVQQPVVTNDDVTYAQYLIGTFPVPMREYLIAFMKLFLRALETEPIDEEMDEG